MKTYGIYLAFPPTVDMRAEGLGRHLAEFLRGAQDREDIRFAIACPSWGSENLTKLFDAFGIDARQFEIISPAKEPLLLRMHRAYLAFRRRRKRRGRLARLARHLRNIAGGYRTYVERTVVGSRSLVLVVLLLAAALPFILIGALAAALGIAFSSIRLLLRFCLRQLWHVGGRRFATRVRRIAVVMSRPKDDTMVTRLYRAMEDVEAGLMRQLINARPDIAAWYSPTAFWPHFNNISAPRLMCVPDVVLGDFPVGFSNVGGSRFLDNFHQIERAISGGQHFVTYSQQVKWHTLVDRYHVDPDMVSVVPHGANRLDQLVTVSGFPDNEATAIAWCRRVFQDALGKATDQISAGVALRGNVKFLFYASQFRPNKNVLSLLRAYDYLLKRRYIGHKLVVTGDPRLIPELEAFIDEHNLKNDVLCLSGLTEQELAACYRLADLAVNPSLSEGGCPFTFSEALSVGTPALMARIPVTEEVITSQELRDLMLFDPYDWKDIAAKIEWALAHGEFLLEKQKPFYEQLAKRTWRTVVDEYIAILNRISTGEMIDGQVDDVRAA